MCYLVEVRSHMMGVALFVVATFFGTYETNTITIPHLFLNMMLYNFTA